MASKESAYQINRTLRPGVTTLATDETGRRVVLKRLPDDCLWRGQLHPSVRARLERFRELPSGSFGDLIGVERIESAPVLVSRYIDGVALDAIEPERRSRLLEELARAVAAVHRLGMVHGAIAPGNVIIDPAGKVHLIDPSPLLHDDPAIDLAALQKLGYSPPADHIKSSEASPEDRRRRRRSLLGAAALVLSAICLAWATVIYLSE